jgi:predicted dehydrogenase
MRVALVGLGSVGRRHLANLRALAPDAEIDVVRHARGDDGMPDGADRVLFSLDEALAAKPDLALICGPTSTHVAAGIAALRAGAHLFVEKPPAPLAGRYSSATICGFFRRCAACATNSPAAPSDAR